jgi:hypothetical protein
VTAKPSVTTRRWFFASICVVGMLAVTAGCGGSERSAAKYCSTYLAEKHAYLDKYNRAADKASGMSDPLGQLLLTAGMTASAIGDVEVMFDKLDRVSPDEIEPDVAAVRDSIKHQLDSIGDMASNPIGALASALVSGFASSGSWQRVGEWTVANCGSA